VPPILDALVDERGQIVVDVCRTGERRKRPREDVASFPEWVARVVVISECE